MSATHDYVLPSKANDVQHGGNHYKQFKGFEPWDVITAWDLGYLEGTALKYIARWKHKNGVEDLKKAVHFLQKKIEVEEAKNLPRPGAWVNIPMPDYFGQYGKK
jgi:hypothetical protein